MDNPWQGRHAIKIKININIKIKIKIQSKSPSAVPLWDANISLPYKYSQQIRYKEGHGGL